MKESYIPTDQQS